MVDRQVLPRMGVANVRAGDKAVRMYDALTARYTFACPHRQETRVPLSDFRLIERLPGPAHPAVYGIRFDCVCGEVHPGLVPHPDLDWAPLGGQAGGFFDLMTSQRSDAGGE